MKSHENRKEPQESDMGDKAPTLLAPLTRRSFLAGTAAVAAMGAARPASGAVGGELVVGNWGGDWDARTVKFIEEPIVEKAGIRIIRDQQGVPERKTKLLAERRLPRGTLDVAHLSDTDAYEMQSQDVLEKLDLSRIPNLKDVPDNLKNDYFVPWQYSGWIIIYDHTKI